jgi:hypothetical protein
MTERTRSERLRGVASAPAPAEPQEDPTVAAPDADEPKVADRQTVVSQAASSPTYSIPPDQYRAEMRAQVAREAEKLNMDETVPGGTYLVDGVLVNAHGQAVDEQGKVKE